MAGPRIRRGHEAMPLVVAHVAAPVEPPPPTMAVMHGDDTLSPVDLPGSTMIGGRPLLWTTTAIYLAALVLLLTNATTLHGWAVELPPSGWSARLVTATERWKATTERLGLAKPRATMHGWWKAAQAARFGDERVE